MLKNTGTVCFKAIPDSSEKDVPLSDVTSSPILEDPVKSVWNEDGADITNKVINGEETVTYTVTFRNPAEEEKAFTVTDEIPAEVSLVEGTVSDGGTVDGKKITWKMALAAGRKRQSPLTHMCRLLTRNIPKYITRRRFLWTGRRRFPFPLIPYWMVQRRFMCWISPLRRSYAWTATI